MRHFAPRWILTRGKEQKVEALMTMRFSRGRSTTKFELTTIPPSFLLVAQREEEKEEEEEIKFESFSLQFTR